MEIYLLRHGMAESARPGAHDGERRLTEEGRRAVEAVMERARAARVSPALILTSTYARAVETAAIAAKVLEYGGPIERLATLQPTGSPFEAWDDIRARQPGGPVLVAAHEPLLSGLAALLLESPMLRLQIGAASMVAVEIERLSANPNGLLKWMITPALA